MKLSCHQEAMLHAKKGFSLIELIVVIAIVGIIAGIAFPSYRNHVERGKLSECANFAYSLAGTLESYYLKNATYTASFSGANSLSSSDVSETGYCTAQINTIGGSCDPADPSERCIGYTIAVTRNNMPEFMLSCETLTLDHRGQKGVSSSGDTVGEVSECW